MTSKHFLCALLLLCTLFLFSGCHATFLSTRMVKKDVSSIVFQYQTPETDLSLTIDRNHPMFAYIWEYADCAFEKIELDLTKHRMDPLKVTFISEDKSLTIEILTLQAKDPYENECCFVIENEVYRAFNEHKALTRFSDRRTIEGTLMLHGKTTHPLYSAFRLLSFSDSFPSYTDLIKKTGTTEDWRTLHEYWRYETLSSFTDELLSSELLIEGTVKTLQADLYDSYMEVAISSVRKGSFPERQITVRTYPGFLFDWPTMSLSDEKISVGNTYLFLLRKETNLNGQTEYILFPENSFSYFKIVGDQLYPYFNPSPEIDALYPHSMDELQVILDTEGRGGS